ncbi:MAG: hypothetical protein IIA72_03195 [Proteobacteria bacterium]|nr:hypothetical protein [Pseudomonadota bacterium]
MSKGSWKRDPTSGLPVKRLGEIDEAKLNDGGGLNPGVYPNCNLFSTNSAAIEAGATNVSRTLSRMMLDPRFHHHKIYDTNGVLVTIATHADSARAWGVLDAVECRKNSLANLRRGLEGGTSLSDVTCGTSAKDVTGA